MLIGIGSSSAVGLISARRLTHRRPGGVRQTRLSFLRPAQGAAGLARALIDFDVWHLGLRSIFDATPAHQANLGAKRIPRTAQNTCERVHTSGFSFVGDVAQRWIIPFPERECRPARLPLECAESR